ncbi:hypothetical protein [uncultured Paludibaculum sp.]|uniref:hypothetical protein n=1 Tax=uncultured Paludibaculum sp. TaxID=1765020 RepID=UPI002AAAB7D8|nr:hypothetical protein [uncultured Paludibaculum sp.]
MEKRSRAEQARINGCKSRGPVTAEGKARSALNAVTHGMSAHSPVLLTDDCRRLFLDHRQAFMQRFQPTDTVEVDIVSNIADAYWNLARYTSYQASLELMELEDNRARWNKQYMGLTVPLQQAKAFQRLSAESNAPALALRYMAHWQRVIDNSLRNLADLRTKCPAEFGTLLADATFEDHLPAPEPHNPDALDCGQSMDASSQNYETNQTDPENKEVTFEIPNPTEPKPEPNGSPIAQPPSLFRRITDLRAVSSPLGASRQGRERDTGTAFGCCTIVGAQPGDGVQLRGNDILRVALPLPVPGEGSRERDEWSGHPEGLDR